MELGICLALQQYSCFGAAYIFLQYRSTPLVSPVVHDYVYLGGHLGFY
jgi:hypothetical protein